MSTYEEQIAAAKARMAFDTRLQMAGSSPNNNAQVAQNVAAQGQAYQFMSPQLAYSLGASGAQPGDPLSQAVATASVNKKGGGFFHALGHIMTAPLRAAAHLATSGLSEAGDIAQPLVRGGLTGLESLYQVPMGVVRDVASSAGDIAAGAVSGLATGAAVGLAGGPLAPISVAAGAVGGAITGGVLGGIAQARGVKVKGGFVNPLAQSTGGLAIMHGLSGEGVDLGSGFLPGGAIKEEQVKNAQQAAAIDGHALTPGRFLASAVSRPGSTAYNVLSGVTDAITQWNLDPAKLLGEDIGAARGIGKIIPGAVDEASPLAKTAGPISTAIARRAGLLESADPAVHSQLATDFLRNDTAAQNFIRKAAGTDDASEIWRASRKKLPAALVNQVAANNTEQGVLDALLNGVEGGTLREKDAVQSGRSILDTVTATRPGARLTATMSRLGGILPAHNVDLLDLGVPGSHKLNTVVEQADNFMTQARFDALTKTRLLNRLMAVSHPEDASNVLDDMVNGHLRDKLIALGHDPARVDGYLKDARAESELLVKQASDEIATNTVPRGVHTGVEAVPINKANEVTEYAKYNYKLPDPTDLRRLTTPKETKIGEALSAFYNSDGWKTSTHAADTVMGVFKKTVTVRPALAVRTLAMQHAKFAANGVETAWSDPSWLIRMATNPEFRTAWHEGIEAGTPLVKLEGAQRVMRNMSGHISDEEQAAHRIIVGPGHDMFPPAWTSRVVEAHADPVVRSIAQTGTEATAQAFWDGPLQSEREALAVAHPELQQSREAADAYIASHAKSLSDLTADNPHLTEAIATGHIPTGEFGAETHIPLLADHADGVVNPDAVKYLANMALDDSIKVPVEIAAAKDPKLIDPDYGNKVGKMTNWFYSTLIGKPMATFYQSPALSQFYWEEAANLAHHLDAAGVEKLTARLAEDSDKIHIAADTRKSLESALARGGAGPVPLSRLDTLAQTRAVDRLQAMTVDMAKKTGWQDAMRHVIPFGKHWQQELTQWTKLAVEHPETIRKAQMTVQGAIGSGFFHKDQYGQYVFNYPGSELVSKVLTGTPMPMTGSAAGLSAMTAGLMPGFGPMVSVAASKLLPNKPEYDEIKSFLSPYGDPTQKGVLSAIEPPWVKTVQAALSNPANDRDAANTTMQIAKYLVSTGKFTTDTPENQQKLLDESGARAKKLLMLQAIGKFVLPSSPSLEAVAEIHGTAAPDGRTVAAKILSDDLKKMRDDNYDQSSENFLHKYGDASMLFLQAASKPLVPGVASTTEQSDFLRANPEIAKALPNSAAFFAPQGGETFDPASIARQIHQGTRQALTPKQQVALANDQVGSMIYYTKKAQFGTHISAPQQAWLGQLKTALMHDYPGFGVTTVGLGATATDDPKNIQNVLIPELQKSLTMPKTADSDTGQALSTYLQVRDKIDTMAQSAGLKPGSFASSTKMVAQRQYLRQIATQLAQNNPGFGMLFDRILDRELRTDTIPGAVSV